MQRWFREAGFPEPKYINAWPYCPPTLKYPTPRFRDSFRIGQLLGVIGRKTAWATSPAQLEAVAVAHDE